jgi:fatty-acyl-CoA synthase
VKPPYSRTFFELLEEQAATRADQPCLITTQTTVSFAQLADRAGRVASTLAAAGVGRGDRVGLLAQNQSEWLEIFFGAVALGATVIPFSTWSTTRELEFLLNDSGVTTLFSIDKLGERSFADGLKQISTDRGAPSLNTIVLIEQQSRHGWPTYSNYLADAAPFTSLAPGIGASAMDTLVVLYTSGSSAHPKAVPLTHARAIENAFNIGERQGYTSDDRVFVPVPLFWSYGAINALPAIFSHGACMVTQTQFQPAEAIELIEQHSCTAIYTLPAITNALLAAPEFAPGRTQSLRTGLTIGTPQDLRRAATDLGAGQICNIYGSTESYGNCAVTWHHWPLEQRALCQGPPLPGVELRTVDPQSRQVCPPDTIGELELRGYLTDGYVGLSAENNAATFRPDGFFRTGDLASISAGQHLAYAGRSSEMIKRSGINVAPAEIEEVLQELPLVGLAGITGIPDTHLGEAIVAYIVRRADPQVSDTQLLDRCSAHCRERLSRYKLPDQIILRADLPLTPTGKLLRKGLKQLAMELAPSA